VWGLGDRYLVKDVDPMSWHDKNHGPNERVYIRKKAPLYKPAASLPRLLALHVTPVEHHLAYDDDDDGSLSPLSSIDTASTWRRPFSIELAARYVAAMNLSSNPFSFHDLLTMTMHDML